MKKTKILIISILLGVGMLISARAIEAITDPVLETFSTNVDSVDTSESDQAVVATFTVSNYGDLNSAGSQCKLVSSSTDQIHYGDVVDQDDDYDCEIILPKGSSAGEWHFSLVLSNIDGSTAFYNSDDIKTAVPDAFGEVIENTATIVDQEGPEIVSFSADPVEINTDTEAKIITASFTIIESSGLNGYSMCGLYSSDIDQVQLGEIVNISGDDYTCDVTIPSGLVGGQWYFQLRLVDNFGNQSQYDASINDNEIVTAVPDAVGTIIQDESITADEIGPTITDFSASPTLIDAGSDEQEIVATFTATDPNGVDYELLSCYLYSPDTAQAEYGDVAYLSDDVFSCLITLPVQTENGDWYFGLGLLDYRGNMSSYSAFDNDNEILTAVPDATGTVVSVVNTVADDEGPVLGSFSATPSTIEADFDAEQIVVVDFSVTDDTQFDYEKSFCYVYGNNDEQYLEGQITYLDSDNYQCTVTFPENVIEGSWYFLLDLRDAYNNRSAYDAEVNGNEIYSALSDAGATSDDTLGIVMAIHPAEILVTITDVSIKVPPTKTEYEEGEALDLSGLEVTLTKSDDSTEDVVLADFYASGITTGPENGATLAVSNTTVVISANGHNTTQEIVVNKAAGEGSSDDGIDDSSDSIITSIVEKITGKKCDNDCKLYKTYKAKYKSYTNKKVYKKLKDLKMNNRGEFERIRTVYNDLAKKGLSSKEIRKLGDNVYSDYKLYKQYRGYKLYLYYKDKN